MEDNKDTVKVEEKVEEPKKEETTEKTYTKEDLDNSFNAGVKKASSEWQKDEKYKEFLEWKKTNQNDSETIKELQSQIEKINEEKATITKDYETLKNTQKVREMDARPDFVRFITSEVMTKVDDTTDFDTALKNFKDENPQYFGEVVIKKVQTSPKLNNSNGVINTNSIMNDVIRQAINNK
jgi:hypothetical protein